ncbi:unnamed protein product [Nyctereutes procyonoides]|uniref:(raccoon dog) hypothetical protein n=1 Tax=Nyctereutes procyonoides TaxID=34880 RepID=A0A811Y3T4_NYCPR|nr:unnamed protein product [Nyctereutes procyonoides]
MKVMAGAEGGQQERLGVGTAGVYSAVIQWNVLNISVKFIRSAVSFIASISLLIFCLDNLSIDATERGWMWSEEHCYYLSTEAQAWEASQAFCSTHHDFLSRYPVSKHSWVGARQGPHGWHWIDGCGGLEEGKLVALDCASPRPWVCAKGAK